MTQNRILITGADGFVGRHLTVFLKSTGKSVRAAVRKRDSLNADQDYVAVGNIDSRTKWDLALERVDTVVHLAAKVHVLEKESLNALEEYRSVNVEGTLNLARQALNAGVRRFVYVSTIKVLGEESGNLPFRPADTPAPQDHYSISKFEAENGLRAICEGSQMQYVIIRPPLIYGKGAKGNFGRLVEFVRKGYYLPLARIRNKRSLIGIDNFCSLLEACIDHPAAAGKVLLASDGQDVSTPDLIRLIARFSNKPVRLFPAPTALLFIICRLAGVGDQMKKLAGNLQVDSSETRGLLHWTPPHSLEQEIAKSV